VREGGRTLGRSRGSGARPLRTAVVAALCVIIAVAGCEGPPAGAKDTVQRLAALDVVTSPPPQGVLVAQAEDLGLDSTIVARDPSVTVVYATTASMDDVRDFYLSAFPAYDVGELCCADAGYIPLSISGPQHSLAQPGSGGRRRLRRRQRDSRIWLRER
jgi:hypothetical protein